MIIYYVIAPVSSTPPNELNINIKFINYILKIYQNLESENRFKGYINKTINTFPQFKNGDISDKGILYDYFNRCYVLSILQYMGMINDLFPNFGLSTGLIKICGKNCCLIDDSTVIDKETEEIRDSIGNEDEPHRGYRLFTSLEKKDKDYISISLHKMLNDLKDIIEKLSTNKYVLFDPVLYLQKIVFYCNKNKMYNLIKLLAWEIHLEPYKLTIDEVIQLFYEYDVLLDKWNTYITDKAKIRIYILCLYAMSKIDTAI